MKMALPKVTSVLHDLKASGHCPVLITPDLSEPAQVVHRFFVLDTIQVFGDGSLPAFLLSGLAFSASLLIPPFIREL